MNREMKAALDAALAEILALSPEEFLREAKDNMSGDVFDFFIQTRKFEEFDLKEIEPLQLHFAETMPVYLVNMISGVQMHRASTLDRAINTENYALAA